MTYFPPVQQLHLQVGATLELFTEKSATLRHRRSFNMSLTCHNCHQDHQALPSTSIHEELDGTIDIVVALVGASLVSDGRSDQDPRDRIHGDFRCKKKGPWQIDWKTFGFVWKCWVNIPNEIAIFHRDNDQQNHWGQWGTRHFQTNPFQASSNRNSSAYPCTACTFTSSCLLPIVHPSPHGIISMFYAWIIEQEAVILTSNSYLSWINANEDSSANLHFNIF